MTWHNINDRAPAEDGMYLIQTETGIDTSQYKNGEWMSNNCLSSQPIQWNDDGGTIPSYPTDQVANPARMMANYLPRTTLIARTPDVNTVCNNGEPCNRQSIEIETVELKTVDVINAFLGLQRQAEEEAQKQHKEHIYHKIRRMVTFIGL